MHIKGSLYRRRDRLRVSHSSSKQKTGQSGIHQNRKDHSEKGEPGAAVESEYSLPKIQLFAPAD